MICRYISSLSSFEAQTPVRPGFEAIPPEVRPVGDPKAVARAAEPLARAGRVASTADWLNARYGDLPSDALLESVVHRLFPGRVAAVSAFGAESAVLLAMVARVAPDLPIVFLDTGQHFPETLAYRNALAARLGLTGLTAGVNMAPPPERPTGCQGERF